MLESVGGTLVAAPWYIILGAISMHFLLGFWVGLLVFSLISTILYRYCSGWRIPDFYINGFSLSVALLCSVVVHILEDYYIGLF